MIRQLQHPITAFALTISAAGISLAFLLSPKADAASDAFDCATYAGTYNSDVVDHSRNRRFTSKVSITFDERYCYITSNGIPDHDFADATSQFRHPVREVSHHMRIPREPQPNNRATGLAHRSYDGIMLNGVPIDLLSAGCYRPNGRRTDRYGNVHHGCRANDDWLLDPMGPNTGFGEDQNHAHTQPDGSYHYHGPQLAYQGQRNQFAPLTVVGFAADGFPIFGPWIQDESGKVRRVRSGYELRVGVRPAGYNGPGGEYSGMYIGDYQFTGNGDLDACNGMTVNGQYGYFLTDAYPWITGCLSGTPDHSFQKRRR